MSVNTRAPRFVLLQVVTTHYHQAEALRDMYELEQLVDTYGGVVVEKSIQHRIRPHTSTYIGEGKVEWLKEIVKTKKIEVIVLNDILKSGQLFRLERILWEVNPRIKVWDRVDLILGIFEQHASTIEAKLQIELARIQHLGPRIYGLGGTVLSRQGAGIGTRGKGETNIEIERRNIRKRTQKIRQQLKQLSHETGKRIEQRRQKGIKTIALVGYTSAGKTTLFNSLTQKTKQTHKGLFTTLDSVVGKLADDVAPQDILISDTIGFIEDLPPFLIEAFRSTLMESLSAEVLLHVVDAADSHRIEKIEVVERILEELDVKKKPILVFNKVDLLGSDLRKSLQVKYAHREKIFVSASKKIGLQELKKQMLANIAS